MVPPRRTDTLIASMTRRLKTLWPRGGLWRHSGLPEALVRSDDQPGRLAGVGPGATAGRRARARRKRVRGRAAGNGRVPALPALRATCRRLGRPAAAAPDPHRHGPLPRAVPRLDTGCVPPRRANHLAALRRRLSRRHLHGLLRRLVPVVPAFARPQGPARGGELAARGVTQRGPDRRARPGRAARRRDHGPVRHPARRAQLPRDRQACWRDSHRGRATAGDRQAEHVARTARGARVPRPPSLLAADLDHDRELELLLDDVRVDHHRLRRARARPLPGGHRLDLLPGQHRRAARRVHRRGPSRRGSASALRSSPRRSCSALR